MPLRLGGARRKIITWWKAVLEFNPLSLFAAAEPGAWYDTTDMSAMFQDSAGTTPVTALGQPVGLVLDKSRGALSALGPELVTNGTFDSGTTGWTASQATLAVSSQRLAVTQTSTFGYAYQSFSTVAGGLYRLEFAYDQGTVSLARYFVGTSVGNDSIVANTTLTGAVTLTRTFIATSTTTFIHFGAQNSSGLTNFFDNISVKLVPGTHAIQPTSASRPLLDARVNLLTRTEEFNNAAWAVAGFAEFGSGSVANTTATTDPLGTNTADYVQETTAAGVHILYNTTGSSVLAARYTWSVAIKSAGRDFAMLNIQNGGFPNSCYALFNVTTGQVITTANGANGTNTTAAISSLGNGWWRCSITTTHPSATTFLIICTADSAAPTLDGYNRPTFTGDATKGLYLWGADLRLASNSAYPYQRVVTATDYADVGAPRMLLFDGVDDSLYTAANLNLSTTDKVTVWAGVYKQSDAAAGLIAELSSNFSFNTGSFYLYPNSSPLAAGPTSTFASRGTFSAIIQQNAESAPFSAPATLVITGTGDIAGDLSTLRVNGAASGTNGTGEQGTGNYGNYVLYIGRRNNSTQPLNGKLGQLIVRGAASDAGTITNGEQYVAQRTGVTL